MSLIVCRFAADIYTLLGFTAASLLRFAANHHTMSKNDMPFTRRTSIINIAKINFKNKKQYASN